MNLQAIYSYNFYSKIIYITIFNIYQKYYQIYVIGTNYPKWSMTHRAFIILERLGEPKHDLKFVHI